MVPESVQLLIAEDNGMNQQLIRHLMRNWGFGFTIVNNGAEAIEALKRQSFLLVLMDIQMPEMDGYIATTVIRNELKLDIPIIAMTAHAMMGEKEKCLQLGMNDYLSKPIKENELYNTIAHYAQLDARRQDTAANTEPAQKHYQYVNLEYLHELSGNDAGFEQEMMLQFCNQVATELSALQTAVAAADFQNIKSIAHSLKSTMGYMGLHEMVNPHLTAIEQAAREAQTDPIAEPLQKVAHIATETVREVNEIIQEGKK
jgi:CheY-like chemotaxis protein